MKIIFLVSWFPPYVGGVPMRAYRIAKGLGQRGHEIIVHTASHPKAPSVENVDGIKIERHDLLSPHISRLIKAPIMVMPSLLKLLSDKEIKKADIVQSFVFLNFVSLVAASLKLFRKKIFVLNPLFALLHATHYTQIYKMVCHTTYGLTLGTLTIRSADFLVPETSAERNDLIRLGVSPEKIKIIPNAIDPEDYKELPNPMIFRNKYGIDAYEKIILFVGRPTLWKGMYHLIFAMPEVLNKIREARLVVVCYFPRRAQELLRNISSDVRERVLITGPLLGKPLISAYSAADVFVLPSRMETFSMVTLEAAAAGLPIVCTRTGAAPDIVTEGENGLFVEYGKIGQISDAIIKVLGDGNFKKRAERRRNLILSNYGVKREIDQYEKIYMQLTG